MKTPDLRIRPATAGDVPVILELICALADFEKLSHEVVADEAKLRATLFGEKPAAEVLIAELSSPDGWMNAGFALFFTTYSTFLAAPGIYLEDLFVKPEFRSRGIGERLLVELASVARSRNCGRLEWSVLNWNKRAWDFYRRLGAQAMDEWTVHRVSGNGLSALAERSTQPSSQPDSIGISNLD